MDTAPMRPNKLTQLAGSGTSVWLDFVSRDILHNGELARRIEADDVRGVTSNPAIFERAIGHSGAYDAQLAALVGAGDAGAMALYEQLAVSDIREAADTLRPVYERTDAVDGYVSLEVAPYLARETEASIAEARRLWREVDRPNLMVKVPGTREGVPAIATLIGEGLNINVTLLFSVAAYQAVADAYMTGLERLAAAGGDVRRVASVASVFVSRIDSAVDAAVQGLLPKADAAMAERLRGLRGRVAIANARLAYAAYQDIIGSDRWRKLAALGARPQRLLWASTGTKLKGLPDTLYVDALVGPETVNTMPPATMEAARDHGQVAPTLPGDVAAARAVLATLAECGISLDAITDALVDDGVQQFIDAADALLTSVALKRLALLGEDTSVLRLAAPEPMLAALRAQTEAWRAGGTVRRLWAGDAGLWTGRDEADWLGWLTLPEAAAADLPRLLEFQRTVAAGAYTDAVLLGMGGSSLGPEVLGESFGHRPGFPRLHVVDSTDPAQLRAVRAAIDISHTIFIVSSKSGSTLEPNLFLAYFMHEAKQAGLDAPRRIVAVTDPGSALARMAAAEGFAHVFAGEPSVGGRFSVLSMFGLVPAAVIGADLPALVAAARRMALSCGADIPAAVNPGVQLGLAMGLAGRAGRDKLTVIASPAIADFGAWLEQLVAESTGKQGHGIIPIDAEPPRPPALYGADRMFVYLSLAGAEDAAQERLVAGLEACGQMVARIPVADRTHLAGEFFRFEMATAVAGSVLGIDAFNQPDVEASKVATRALMDAAERGEAPAAETALASDGGVAVFADARNAAALSGDMTVAGVLRAHLARLGPGDYVALLAYVPRNAGTIAAMTRMRALIGRRYAAAVAAGFGPRFLHSTGQAYKGGPNSGVFVQITCADEADLPVPGKPYGFSAVKAAQALGDLQVLNERGRRALRVHLADGWETGLPALEALLAQVLG